MSDLISFLLPCSVVVLIMVGFWMVGCAFLTADERDALHRSARWTARWRWRASAVDRVPAEAHFWRRLTFRDPMRLYRDAGWME